MITPSRDDQCRSGLQSAVTPLRHLLHALEKDDAIPIPFNLGIFITRLEERRDRRIRVGSFPASPDTPYGLLVSTHDTDYILHAAPVSPFYGDHIIAHELGHLLLQHSDDSCCGMSEDVLERLMPNLDPAMISRVLGRTGYTDAQEREAELFATLILADHQGHALWPTRNSRRSRRAGLRGGGCEPDVDDPLESLERLSSLWGALTEAVPHVVLSLSDTVSACHPHQQLHRCLVEINDALLVLAPYWADRIVAGDGPLGLSPAGAQPDSEAMTVSTVLAARTEGRVTSALKGAPLETARPPATVRDEVRRFEFLSLELQRCGFIPGPGVLAIPC